MNNLESFSGLNILELNDAVGKMGSQKEHSAADCQMVHGRQASGMWCRWRGCECDSGTAAIGTSKNYTLVSLGYWNMVSVFSEMQMVFQYT